MNRTLTRLQKNTKYARQLFPHVLKTPPSQLHLTNKLTQDQDTKVTPQIHKPNTSTNSKRFINPCVQILPPNYLYYFHKR